MIMKEKMERNKISEKLYGENSTLKNYFSEAGFLDQISHVSFSQYYKIVYNLRQQTV